MIPNTISFLCTYKCNFLCTHCSVPTSLESNLILQFEYIRKAIDEAYKIPSIQVVVFSGGESTLYPHLKPSIKYASENGFTVRIVTNAWWAENYDKARTFLEELQSVGLMEVNISYDDFHLEYLKKFGGEQNIINAVDAARDLGLTVLIAITKLPESKISTKYIRRRLPEVIKKDALLLEDFIAPLGRAKTLRSKLRLKSDNLDFGCIDLGTTAISPDGRITACCGHIFSSDALKMFELGNIKKDGLIHAVKRMQRNVLYWWIALRGPVSILKTLKIEEEVYHKCEACDLLYKYNEKLRSIALKKEIIMEKLRKGEEIELHDCI